MKSFSKRDVYRTSKKITDTVKKNLAGKDYEMHKEHIMCDGESYTLKVYEMNLLNVCPLLNEVTVKVYEANDDLDMDDVVNALNGHCRGRCTPERDVYENLISAKIYLNGWCKKIDGEWKLGLSFYDTIGHEVNHFYQDKYKRMRLKDYERSEYVAAVRNLTGGSLFGRCPSDLKNYSYLYYFTCTNEMDSNVQGFANIMDAVINNPTAKESIDVAYNIKRDEISNLREMMEKTTYNTTKISHKIDKYETNINKLYNKAMAEIA